MLSAAFKELGTAVALPIPRVKALSTLPADAVSSAHAVGSFDESECFDLQTSHAPEAACNQQQPIDALAEHEELFQVDDRTCSADAAEALPQTFDRNVAMPVAMSAATVSAPSSEHAPGPLSISAALGGDDRRSAAFKSMSACHTLGPLAEDEEYVAPSTDAAVHAAPMQLMAASLSRARSMPTRSSQPVAIASSSVGSGSGISFSGAAVGDGAGGAWHRRRCSSEFRPPHEVAADESAFAEPFSESFVTAASATRHKSIADRLKSVVFEQTGHVPSAHSCGKGFLG